MVLLLFTEACSQVPVKPGARSLAPARPASLEELVNHVNRSENQPKAIKGSLVMGFQTRPDQPVRYCSGHMLLSAHKELYLKGHGTLLPTFFTLVSNGREFWLHVPRDNTVYTGLLEAECNKNEQFGIDLNLRDLFRALFPCPIEDGHLIELEAGDPYYVLSIFNTAGTDKRLCRRLWVGKDRCMVEKEEYYNADGGEELEIRRSNFLESACCLFPKEITLQSTVTGSAVSLTFNQVTMNPEGLESTLFHFDVPEGVVMRIIE